MPYNNMISRTDAAALIPESVAAQLLQTMTTQSAALRLFRRLPVSVAQTRLPVLAALPTAYFVNGDTGLKQTTEMSWANKYLNIEELAAIVPIPEAVLDDASYDIWGTARPLLEEAIGLALDAAVFLGINKPASWPDDLLTAAIAASNAYTRGTNLPEAGGIAEDINLLMGLVEADGFDVNGMVADRKFKAKLRSARDSTGQKILDFNVSDATVDGIPIAFAMPGAWPTISGSPELFVGDFQNGVIGVRSDFTYKVLDQAVIQDNTGAIIYNLAQQDMVALRVTFRVGFQVANVINRQQQVEASRYPFGVLRAP